MYHVFFILNKTIIINQLDFEWFSYIINNIDV